VAGWGGFVLKDKLKVMKGALKEWHAAHAHNLSSRIDSLKVRLSALDLKGEQDTLSEAEVEELHGVTTDIHSLSRLQASINWQQSRSRWLKEGDANSKYFHSLLASRRRGNSISSVQVAGETLKGFSLFGRQCFPILRTTLRLEMWCGLGWRILGSRGCRLWKAAV
jgi:hypothetical protein